MPVRGPEPKLQRAAATWGGAPVNLGQGYDVSGPFTLSALLRAGAEEGRRQGGRVLSKRRGRTGWELVAPRRGTGEVSFFCADGHISLGTTRIDDDRWHHIAVTFDAAGDLRCYVDGRPDGSRRSSVRPQPDGDLWLGAREGVHDIFLGDIREVQVFDEALPEDSLAALLPEAQAPRPRELSAGYLEGLLQELVEGFREPRFQAELVALHAAGARAGMGADVKRCLRPLALRVQGPVLRRYGLPPDEDGVALLKDLVRRRVAEGAGRIRSLGDEARRLLGLPALPDASAPAERALAEMADKTETCLREWARSEKRVLLVQQCRARLAAERASGDLPAASALVLEMMLEDKKCTVEGVLALLNIAKVGVPPAALRGSSAAPEILVLEAPSARELFEACVLNGRPAILRRAVQPGRFPPLAELASLDVLRRLCGHRRVPVKSFAHADADGRPVFTADPGLRMPLSDFIDGLEEHESGGPAPPFYLGKVPLRQELPELADLIARAETCPQREYGSCFGPCLPQGCFTYFGCGRNTTPIHFDAYENLMLCVLGHKRLLLYPPADARYLYPVGIGGLHWEIDFTNSAVPPFVCTENLDSELKARYKLLSCARPVEVNLGPGEIIYLPACWWHCVEGSEDRNMILTWWFELHAEKRALAGFKVDKRPTSVI